jgi:hypothetical protein
LPAFSLAWNLPLCPPRWWAARRWPNLPLTLELDPPADVDVREEAASDDPPEARACCDRNISKKRDAMTTSSVRRTARRHAYINRGSSGKWYVVNPPLSSPKDPINR